MESPRHEETSQPRVFTGVDDVYLGGERDAVQRNSTAGLDGYRGGGCIPMCFVVICVTVTTVVTVLYISWGCDSASYFSRAVIVI